MTRAEMDVRYPVCCIEYSDKDRSQPHAEGKNSSSRERPRTTVSIAGMLAVQGFAQCTDTPIHRIASRAAFKAPQQLQS